MPDPGFEFEVFRLLVQCLMDSANLDLAVGINDGSFYRLPVFLFIDITVSGEVLVTL